MGDLGDCCCQCPHPCGELSGPADLLGDAPALASFGSVSCGGYCSFPWVLRAQDFVCDLQDWSLCFQSCGSHIIISRWPSRSDPRRFPVPLPDLQDGKANMGSGEAHNSGRTYLVLRFCVFVGHPPSGYGI